MAVENKVEVINKMGWRKDFVLEKPMIQIGRDSRNDIVLDDGQDNGIAPRHAQLLPSSGQTQGMRLINLSDREITVYPPSTGTDTAEATPAAMVEPRSSTEIGGGDVIKLGEFTLIFHGGEQRSEAMRVKVETKSKELALDEPLTGTLHIHHLGNQAGVQFKIEVEGLESDCYEMGPGPVLFPNAEKQVTFRLHHPKRAYPPAGNHRITFHVTAPEAYPDEQASASTEIHVAPYQKHKIRVRVMDSADYRLG